MSVKQTANVVDGWEWHRSVGVDFGTRCSNAIVFSSGAMVKPTPDRIIYNDRTTIVYWEDGTKTTSRCMDGDPFSKEAGFLACLAKKVYGGHNQYKKYVKNAQVQSNQAPA